MKTGAVGLLRHGHTGLSVGDRHGRTNQHASGRVGDHSGDLAERLSER